MSIDATHASGGLAGDRAVELIITPRTRPVGNGQVRRLLPFAKRRMVGPFIFADLIGPDVLEPGGGVDIDAHPHIGLATVTYLFAGTLVHRDSTGAVQRIEPGAVNWMSAGRGVCHTERSPDDERSARRVLAGLQTWVALPASHEDADPFFQHVDAVDVQSASGDGVTVRLAAGSGFGLTSPVRVVSPLILAELLLSGGSIIVPADHAERAVLLVDGHVALNGNDIEPGHLVVLADGSTPVLSGRGRVMMLGGESVGARHIWWNFVSSDRERIETAKIDWAAQRFPLVPGDHTHPVPAPSN
ncbi:MAG: pirin family protein [Acidimicrobiia bacterium]